MKKNTLLIQLFNFINYFLLNFFSFKGGKSNNLMFIQTGGIGDLVIFSKLVEVLKYLENYEVYFLIREEFSDLFEEYRIKKKIIPLKINKFRYNIFYRYYFIQYLKSLKIYEVYNLTSARTAWNDCLALCIGANKTICNYNNWNTVYPSYKNSMHKKYDIILNKDIFNEYNRIDEVIKFLQKAYNLNKIYNDNTESTVERKNDFFDLVIAPFSSENNRNWDIINFIKIVKKFESIYKILIVISPSQEIEAKKHFIKFSVSFSTDLYDLTELKTVIANSKLFIGLDSGITHIALTTNIKIIAIIGGGNYGRYLPKPNDFQTKYLFHQLDCFGCEWQCILKEKKCITKVTVERIYSAICQILECD